MDLNVDRGLNNVDQQDEVKNVTQTAPTADQANKDSAQDRSRHSSQPIHDAPPESPESRSSNTTSQGRGKKQRYAQTLSENQVKLFDEYKIQKAELAELKKAVQDSKIDEEGLATILATRVNKLIVNKVEEAAKVNLLHFEDNVALMSSRFQQLVVSSENTGNRQRECNESVAKLRSAVASLVEQATTGMQQTTETLRGMAGLEKVLGAVNGSLSNLGDELAYVNTRIDSMGADLQMVVTASRMDMRDKLENVHDLLDEINKIGVPSCAWEHVSALGEILRRLESLANSHSKLELLSKECSAFRKASNTSDRYSLMVSAKVLNNFSEKSAELIKIEGKLRSGPPSEQDITTARELYRSIAKGVPKDGLRDFDYQHVWSEMEGDLLMILQSFYSSSYSGVVDTEERREIENCLGRMGIRAMDIKLRETEYDPSRHEILGSCSDSEDLAPRAVVQVVEQGFVRLDGELISKAKIITHTSG